MKGQPIDKRGAQRRDILGPVYFAALSVAVWGPALFVNGYVLLGDMVFAPAMNAPGSLLGPVIGTLNVNLVYAAAWAVSRVVGAVLLQKVVLFLSAFLAGWLAYRNVPCESRWGKLVAGTIYLVNPFVYVRLLMGQWGLMLGYALLPVALASAVRTAREPGAGRCARTALWLALIAVLSLHMGVIALIICAVAAAFVLSRKRPAGKRAASLAALAVVLALFLLVSAFWLLPAARGSSGTEAIGRADLRVFQTRSTSTAGTWLSVVGLYGYWKTALDPFLPRGHLPLWPVLAAGLAALAVAGFALLRKDPERGPLARALLVLGLLGFLLALGSRAPLFGPLYSFLYDHLAVFRLFREPQKFAALLALSYAFLGGLAIDRLVSGRGRRSAAARSWRTWLVPALVVLAVFAYSFRMFGGLWGEARAVDYPRSWGEARQLLERDAGDYSVLYLPPYWFMRFDFTRSDLTITSPMRFYFTNRYVELGGLLVGGVQIDARRMDRYVQSALESAREERNLGALLAPLNVRYVLMPLNTASERYRFVEEQGDLEVVRRWDDLVLLRNRVPTGHLVAADERGSWRDLEELGRAAEGGNLLGSFLPKGRETFVPDAQGAPVEHSDRATGGVRVEGGSEVEAGWLLFSEEYDDRWRLDGARPDEQAGVTCAFERPRPAGAHEISYHDPLVVAGYTLSGAGLLLCLMLMALDNRRKKRTSVTDEQPREP